MWISIAHKREHAFLNLSARLMSDCRSLIHLYYSDRRRRHQAAAASHLV